MIKRDYAFIALLFLLACLIWIRDLAWLSSVENTLPIIVAIPLFFWLGRPWSFVPRADFAFSGALAISVLGFVLGVVTGYTLCFAIGWTLLLWSWLSMRIKRESLASVKPLMVLPLMAFPWIALDGDMLGWWFRLSGAWTTAHFFSLMGFDVIRQGTQLIVEGLPIDVSAPCAGLNVLQSMLIVGSVIAYIQLGGRPAYWWNLPLLVILAWVANTVRILIICLAALTLSPGFAMGMFHTLGGWLVLLLMFFLCMSLFSLQRARPSRPLYDIG